MRIILIVLYLFVGINYINLYSQPFQVCNAPGTGNSCKCSTAPVLCTIGEINGYMFQMSTYQHPADGPTPMCPGVNNTTSNNPTWVAFRALCSAFTVQLDFSGCTGSGLSRGLQAAIYASCGNLPGSVVTGGCSTDYAPFPCGAGCYGCGVVAGSRIMNVSGLVPGQVYYLLVDGCGGSSCNVTITVTLPAGCTDDIGPFTSGIAGPADVCVGDAATYYVSMPVGGTNSTWKIRDMNGNLITTLDDGGYFTSPPDPAPPAPATSPYTKTRDPITWNTVGTFQICVDVYNQCVPVGANPMELCKTIHVYDVEAGNITATVATGCPGRTVNLAVTGNNMETGVSQYILIVDNATGLIVSNGVIPGPNGTFTYNLCGSFTAYSYNYVTTLLPVPTVGQNINSIITACNATCCELASAPFSFTDNVAPVFSASPPDLTFSCIDDVPPMPTLSYTDNCISPGTITGVQVNNYTNCGGSITRTWTITDQCNNTATEVQTITLTPVPPATFTPFPDVTVTCDNFPATNFLPVLNYTNSQSGTCLISGSIVPTRVVDTMSCVGTVTYTWQTTDICGRNIYDQQVYTILPPPVATFTPFNDVTVSCAMAPDLSYMPVLTYDNGLTGLCKVQGSINPVRTTNIVNCQGTITYTWSGNDRCGRPIFDQQVFTVQPPPVITFINPPSPALNITCSQIPAPGVLPPLMYDNGASGNCKIYGTVIPTRTDAYTRCGGAITYTWTKTDSCGRTINHQQVLNIQPTPPATFINPPANTTLPCGQFVPAGSLPPLSYSNNEVGFCSISGSVIPTRVDNVMGCSGTVTFNWQFTDECGRSISHQQVITLSPPDPAAFINPPANITVDCPNAPDPNVLPTLNYTNGSSGACDISGTVTAVRTGSLVNCQGVYTYTWQTTDYCGRQITHVQTVTIQAPTPASFINPPANITVDCPNAPDPNVLPTLNYANGMTGACGINGSVQATRTGALVNCQGVYTYTWQITDQCNRTLTHVQTVTIQAPTPATFINPPANITVDCPNAPDPNVLPTLNYANGMTGACGINGSVQATRTGTLVNCQGVYTYTWQITDQCNRTLTHVQTVTIQAPTPATFINPPANTTVDCPNAPDPNVLPTLSYTNGLTGACGINGSVQATRTGSLVNCQGVYTYTWQITDQCNRTLTHVQTITIQAPTPAAFINPPANITVDCPNAPDPNALPTLNYANGMTGACGINGMVQATKTGSLVNCQGVYTYTWEITDQCNRTLTHVQTVTIQAPPPATFINPPANITVDCPNAPDPNLLPTLNYTNGLTGACGINGMVQATKTGSLVNCQGVYTYTWEITDQCNRTLTHVQTVTIQAPPPATFVNPPASITVDCPNAPDPNILPTLDYGNGMTGACGINGQVQATRTGSLVNCQGVYTYTWQITDQCNRTLTHVQTVTIQAPPPATFVNPPASITVDCPNAPDPNILPTLDYGNGMTGACGINGQVQATRTGSLVNCQGVYTYTWQITDQCNRTLTHVQTVTIQAPPPATFVNPPASITVDCPNAPDPNILPTLDYGNGMTGACGINGQVQATKTGSLVNCQGVYTYTWQITDQCNRTLTHVQTVTIQAPPPATFINPPADITVDCPNAPDPNSLPTLNYANGMTGACGINGMVQATKTGSLVNCQGVYTYTWEITDQCNRTLTHVQTVTIQAPTPATFINPPADITVDCPNAPDPNALPTLDYANGMTGACGINGQVQATKTGTLTNCQGIYTYTWEITDQCNRTLTHTQRVTILPPTPATFINPPADVTVDCQNSPDPNIQPALNYDNGMTGSCAISGQVLATVNQVVSNCNKIITYTWQTIDPCGRSLQWTQVITVLPPPEAYFVNPPPAVQTLNCDEEPDPSILPTLSFTNGASGACLIDGSVPAVRTVVVNNCSKTITYTWETTDFCNRTISYTQVLNILPPPVASITNGPVYTDPITCSAAQTLILPDVSYSNNSVCLVSGTISPTLTKNFDACGGNIQVQWAGVDVCNRPLSYNQIILVSPSPTPVITTPVPDDITVGCQDISAFAIPLQYSNGESFPCARQGVINPVIDADYTLCGGTAKITWTGQDVCGHAFDETLNIQIEPSPPAEFKNLPPDETTVACTESLSFPPPLFYSNDVTAFVPLMEV